MEEKHFKWMTTILCCTFNQSKYISDTLNGFVMQQTDFPFVILVVDDASTDGEQDVIRQYLADQFDVANKDVAYEKETDYAFISFAQHKSNRNCFIAVSYLKVNHYGTQELYEKKLDYLSCWRNDSKYEAFCEGDDYWIESNKLQMQIDFLESNPEYGMCYTNCNVLYNESGRYLKDLLSIPGKKKEYADEADFIKSRGYVVPPSWVYRRDLNPQIHLPIQSMDGSFVMFTYFLAESKVKYIDKITAVYRVLANSACHFDNYEIEYKREKNILKVQHALCDFYELPDEVKNECSLLHYRYNLNRFLAHDKMEDVDAASRIIGHKTLKENVIFFLSKYYLCKKILQYIYRLSHKY